jgi:hypothetical protein
MKIFILRLCLGKGLSQCLSAASDSRGDKLDWKEGATIPIAAIKAINHFAKRYSVRLDVKSPCDTNGIWFLKALFEHSVNTSDVFEQIHVGMVV